MYINTNQGWVNSAHVVRIKPEYRGGEELIGYELIGAKREFLGLARELPDEPVVACVPADGWTRLTARRHEDGSHCTACEPIIAWAIDGRGNMTAVVASHDGVAPQSAYTAWLYKGVQVYCLELDGDLKEWQEYVYAQLDREAEYDARRAEGEATDEEVKYYTGLNHEQATAKLLEKLTQLDQKD